MLKPILRSALDRVEALGVPWRGTRFDHYLQVIQDHASLTREQLLAKPGTTLASEALRQADQLTEASLLFPSFEKKLLVEKPCSARSRRQRVRRAPRRRRRAGASSRARARRPCRSTSRTTRASGDKAVV